MTVVQLGQMAESLRIVSLKDFVGFANLSGDKNPIHTDRVFAATTRYGKVIAPGLLIGSYISALIANQLPGPGSIYVSQTLEFKRPVFEDEAVRVRVRVDEIIGKGLCRLFTTCENGQGKIVVVGAAVVKYPTDEPE